MVRPCGEQDRRLCLAMFDRIAWSGGRPARPTESLSSAAQRVITETPCGDYPARNVRECRVPGAPKTAGWSAVALHVTKTAVSPAPQGGSAPLSFNSFFPLREKVAKTRERRAG
jgi:hypothetical protein